MISAANLTAIFFNIVTYSIFIFIFLKVLKKISKLKVDLGEQSEKSDLRNRHINRIHETTIENYSNHGVLLDKVDSLVLEVKKLKKDVIYLEYNAKKSPEMKKNK